MLLTSLMLTYHFQRWYRKIVMVVVIFVWTLSTFDFKKLGLENSGWSRLDWKSCIIKVKIGKQKI